MDTERQLKIVNEVLLDNLDRMKAKIEKLEKANVWQTDLEGFKEEMKSPVKRNGPPFCTYTVIFETEDALDRFWKALSWSEDMTGVTIAGDA